MNEIVNRVEETIRELERMGVHQTIEVIKVIKSLEWIIKENEQNTEWVQCSEKMPEEHESIFAKLKGTENWNNAMFEKCSDKVAVTVEFENRTRKVMVMGTLDGKWDDRPRSVNKKVIAWMPLPEPYGKEERR